MNSQVPVQVDTKIYEVGTYDMSTLTSNRTLLLESQSMKLGASFTDAQIGIANRPDKATMTIEVDYLLSTPEQGTFKCQALLL